MFSIQKNVLYHILKVLRNPMRDWPRNKKECSYMNPQGFCNSTDTVVPSLLVSSPYKGISLFRAIILTLIKVIAVVVLDLHIKKSLYYETP